MYRFFLAASAAFFMLAGSAFAQSVDVNPYMTTVVAPLAVTVLSGVASVVLGLAYGWLQRKWGLDIESRHREALHSAIVSGINLAVSKTGSLGKIPAIPVGNHFTKLALEYVLRSVPDAVAKFDLTPERVEQMILAKIPQVTGQTSPSVSPPVSGN